MCPFLLMCDGAIIEFGVRMRLGRCFWRAACVLGLPCLDSFIGRVFVLSAEVMHRVLVGVQGCMHDAAPVRCSSAGRPTVSEGAIAW
jgi:hypothetical protein